MLLVLLSNGTPSSSTDKSEKVGAGATVIFLLEYEVAPTIGTNCLMERKTRSYEAVVNPNAGNVTNEALAYGLSLVAEDVIFAIGWLNARWVCRVLYDEVYVAP